MNLIWGLFVSLAHLQSYLLFSLVFFAPSCSIFRSPLPLSFPGSRGLRGWVGTRSCPSNLLLRQLRRFDRIDHCRWCIMQSHTQQMFQVMRFKIVTTSEAMRLFPLPTASDHETRRRIRPGIFSSEPLSISCAFQPMIIRKTQLETLGVEATGQPSLLSVPSEKGDSMPFKSEKIHRTLWLRFHGQIFCARRSTKLHHGLVKLHCETLSAL